MEETKLNNARIQTFGAYIPVYDVEEVNRKKGIWRGKRIVEPEMREEEWPFVYFSRLYDPETNDLDKIFPELQWDDPELLGVPFVLIQKEKLLFRYMPSSLIALPRPKGRIRPNMPRM